MRNGIQGMKQEEFYACVKQKPYVSYCTRLGVKTYKKRIFKTYSKHLANSLIGQGWELLSVTTNGKRSRPKYTIWGIAERLSTRHNLAIKEKVLFPMGFRDNDEQLVRIKREGREYV